MKIAYVLGEYPSLSETFIAREIEALRRRGFEIDIWALSAGEGARRIETPASGAMRVWRKLTGSNEKYWHAVGLAWTKNQREKLKGVQHIHAGWASHPATIARAAAGVLGVPFSFSGHARDLWVDGRDLDAKLRAAKFASCCTRAGVEYLQNIAPDAAHRVLYAPHGLELSKYSFHEKRDLHDPIRVLAVGRLVEKKGFSDLLQCLGGFKEYARYRFHLTIIGAGPQRKTLEKLARAYGIAEQIHFAGALPHTRVMEAMRDSDLLAMPSTQATDGDRDGLPNVLLEAAACGLPIVSTRAGAIEEFLDESHAWLWPQGTLLQGELLSRAVELYPHSLERARNARARVEEYFDIEKNIEVLARAFTDPIIS